MEILTKLTPAETYLLEAGNLSVYKNMLKYTMADLITKKVLAFENRGLPFSEEIAHYITRGSNYDTYKPLPHERPFTDSLQYDPNFEILFKDLVKIAYQKIGGQRKYVFQYLVEQPTVKESIQTGFFKRLFNTISFTAVGEKNRSEVTAAIKKLEETFPRLIEENPAAAREILNKIGGNIYLLKSFDFQLLSKLDEEFKKTPGELADTAVYDGTGDLLFWSYFMFDEFSHDFEGSYDAFDSDGGGWGDFGGDSGDFGGDSGCSGCSGCGGCGGCGG
ncbi:MAG: hypothetical protein AAFO69_16585 [Bacteroidota bacterium]